MRVGHDEQMAGVHGLNIHKAGAEFVAMDDAGRQRTVHDLTKNAGGHVEKITSRWRKEKDRGD